MEAHVVCRECGARWKTTRQPRQCQNPECEAGWLDLPQFVLLADADMAAEAFASEDAAKVAAMREP